MPTQQLITQYFAPILLEAKKGVSEETARFQDEYVSLVVPHIAENVGDRTWAAGKTKYDSVLKARVNLIKDTPEEVLERFKQLRTAKDSPYSEKAPAGWIKNGVVLYFNLTTSLNRERADALTEQYKAIARRIEGRPDLEQDPEMVVPGGEIQVPVGVAEDVPVDEIPVYSIWEKHFLKAAQKQGVSDQTAALIETRLRVARAEDTATIQTKKGRDRVGYYHDGSVFLTTVSKHEGKKLNGFTEWPLSEKARRYAEQRAKDGFKWLFYTPSKTNPNPSDKNITDGVNQMVSRAMAESGLDRLFVPVYGDKWSRLLRKSHISTVMQREVSKLPQTASEKRREIVMENVAKQFGNKPNTYRVYYERNLTTVDPIETRKLIMEQSKAEAVPLPEDTEPVAAPADADAVSEEPVAAPADADAVSEEPVVAPVAEPVAEPSRVYEAGAVQRYAELVDILEARRLCSDDELKVVKTDLKNLIFSELRGIFKGQL